MKKYVVSKTENARAWFVCSISKKSEATWTTNKRSAKKYNLNTAFVIAERLNAEVKK